MSRRAVHLRFVLWAAACLMLLKAAMPMLASVSAEAQGKTLVEVCTAYGVATVALDGDADSHPAAAHGGECALGALVLLGGGEPDSPALPSMQGDPAHTRISGAEQAHDACAAWAARLRHGPPPFA